MKKIFLIISLIFTWDSAMAQCLSQAGSISTSVSSPKFCRPNGGALHVDITYSTAPVASDVYAMLIVDNLTQTIQAGIGIGSVPASSNVLVNIPGTLIAGNYQIYGLNIDVTDSDIGIIYPGGFADIVGTTLASFISNIENLGGISGTGDICGDITTTFVSFDIYDLPTVTFTAPADICIGSPAQNGLGGGSPAGGVYSGPGVTDDGNGLTYTFDPSALLNGIKTLTYTYTNANGCTNSSNDDIEIFPLPPVVYNAPADVCPGSSVVVGQTGGSPTGGVYSGTGVTDDGNGMTYSFDPVSAGVGIHLITYEFTDGNGCYGNSSDNIEVGDAIDPTAVCQNIDVYLDAAGNATIVAADIDGGSTDDCGAVTLSASKTTFTCGDLGTNDVTLTVTDGSANSTDCIAVVTVIDTISPVLTCPGNQTETPNAFCQLTLPDYTALGSVTDNCTASPTITQSPIPGSLISGTTTITLTAMDANGNSRSCLFDVVLFELIPPTASNPADITVECVGDIPAPDVNVVTDAMDNCGTTMVTWSGDVSDGNSCPETITRTYNVADESGNSIDVTQTIIVMDVTSPTASNPGNITVQCITNFPTPNVSVVTDEADNCSTPTVTFVSDVTDGLSCPETFTRTYRVTDDCGNSIDVQQLIIVNDISAPVPNLATLPTETFSCTTLPQAPTATDNCSGTILGVSDLVLPITSFGATTITWTFTDDCGNESTQTQNVNITAMDVSTFVLNDNVTIVANNTGGSYQWIDCGTSQPIQGETGPSYTATYNGSFAVEITKGNCFDVSACVTISTIGIETLKMDDSFMIYPNPTNGTVTISSEMTFNKVEVMNALGQKVGEYNISKTSKYSLTLPEENGVYLVKIYNNDFSIIKRIVKK